MKSLMKYPDTFAKLLFLDIALRVILNTLYIIWQTILNEYWSSLIKIVISFITDNCALVTSLIP